ncbi:MAG: adenosylcobinamide amidohydrolase [Roseiflexaceae bacterium]
MDEALPIDGVYLVRSERALYVRSDAPLFVLSSAVAGGELARTRHIINMHVPRGYACPWPVADLAAMARTLGVVEPFVGLMTAASLERARVVVERDEDVIVVAVVTVGLGNPIAAGVTEVFQAAPGTINIILLMEAQLSQAARVNAVITATEAKTLALVESGVRAPHGGPASGTSTDALVIASTGRGVSAAYAGPITPIGALIARAVRRAVWTEQP